MTAPAIIDAWLAVDIIPGRNQADALRDLNEALGTRYTDSRLGEWRNERRTMPNSVRAHMLAIGIERLLRAHGLDPHDATDEQLDALAVALA